MIAPICLLAFLGLSNCLEQLPTRREIEMSINRTIDEVERMVSEDPSLPRLSRSEIVDILFNITSSDMDSYDDHLEKTREDYQRALMVVLPYSAKDSSNDSLNDLYTKAPHVSILPDSSPESTESSKTRSTKSPVSSTSNSIKTDTKWSENRVKDSVNHYKNHRDTYSEVSSEPPDEQALRKLLNNDRKQSRAPEKFTFNLASFDSSNRESSTSLPEVRNDVRKRVDPASRTSLEIVYSTSVTDSPITTKMIVHTTELSQDYRAPTMPPTRSTQNVLTSDQWRYNAPPSTTTMKPKRTTPGVIGSQGKPTSHHFLPTMMTGSDATVTASTTHGTATTTLNGVVDLRKNQGSEFHMANLDIVNENERPAPVVDLRKNQGSQFDMANLRIFKENERPAPVVDLRKNQGSQSDMANLGIGNWNERPAPVVDLRKNQGSQSDMANLGIGNWNERPAPVVDLRKNQGSELDMADLRIVNENERPAPVVDLRKNQGSQFDMANLRIVNENERPAPVYVTPMSSTSAVTPEDSVTTDNTPEVSKTTTPMREEVQTLLASIGLRPEVKPSDAKKPNRVEQEQDKIFGTNFRIPESKDVALSQLSGLEAVEVGSPSRNQLTYDNAPQDVRLGVSNLSPEVQLLFQRFGLQTSGKERDVVPTTTTVRPRPSTGKAGFWNSFKPLPASEVKDEGMKDFLAKFGLGTVSRNEKAMKERKSGEERPSLIEAVPGNMRQILENIGLIRRPQKAAVPKVVVGTTAAPQLHVFKPHETSLDDEKQRTRINALLDTVKRVQEGKADAVAVQKAAKELLETTKSLKSGPDPLSLDEILKIYNDDVKNEIKRQQDPKDLAEMASSETPDTASTTTSTPDSPFSTSDNSAASSDSASASSDTGSAPIDFLGVDPSTDAKNGATEETTTANSNLEALADSFGGSTAAPDPVLPTRRKTGLYFLVDWNTFLEVGEEGSDKVNLRFQPKVGDRTRFLPVTVP